MSFRHDLQILIMDSQALWISNMKRGLELIGSEYQIRMSENEPEAINICTKNDISAIILDPEDFQSACMIRMLQNISRKWLILLLVLPESALTYKNMYKESDNILVISRPCSFKTVHDLIQKWVYGKKVAVSYDVCSAFLLRWGFSRVHIGFGYLCEALKEFAMDPRQSMKSIYLTMEDSQKNSARNIQNSIRVAVKNAWEKGRMCESFEHLPDNKEILMTIYKELDKSI